MNMQVEGINFLKYVLEMIARLGYSEPHESLIKLYHRDDLEVELIWDFNYNNTKVLVLKIRIDGSALIYLRCKTYGTVEEDECFSFKTSDIRIVV